MNEPFRVILADPPWNYRQGGRGAARNHYPCMKTEEIAALPIGELCADDAVLFCWGTNPCLPDLMQVTAGWGFTWKTGMPWVKVCKTEPLRPHMGGGQWLRGCSEYLSISIKGKPAIVKPAPIGIILAPRVKQTHSRKPVEAYRLAERYPGPRLELFGRQPREGWEVWGNEIDGKTICQHIEEYQ